MITDYKKLHFPPVSHLTFEFKLPDNQVSEDVFCKISFYPKNEIPIFFGHYWKRKPRLLIFYVSFVPVILVMQE